MRKKVNTISIILFVVCAIVAVVLGWIDDDKAASGGERTWVLCLTFVAATFVIGIVRFFVLLKVRGNEKAEYVPVRSVTIGTTVSEENGVETELTDKVPLIYIDNVRDDKVVVSLYKEPVAVPNAASKVNEQ